MLFFAFLLDEDKIKEEKKYDLYKMYKYIDDIYGELQGKLIFTRDKVRFYSRVENDGNDYQRLWIIALGLREAPWFFDNLKAWRFMICDDETGKASYAEDLINNVRVI